ncbi:MCM4 [Hepatospora eriocheir]|uniref:DNA replication licensing factor MCM4 n=1 Tax=Hepatospora eriocheir TaxID=1081669 RepID=A0A1X0QIL4_9MICR|nr:MCM4 [Hepatospora eriocheir]
MDNNNQRNSDFFSYEEASQDFHLTLSAPNTDYSNGSHYIETERVKVIWGTTINVSETIENFKSFIRSSSGYLDRFEDIRMTENFIYNLDCSILPELLYKQLEDYPTEMIPIIENALCEIYLELNPNWDKSNRFVIRPYNIGRGIVIRNIEPTDIDKIIKLTGMISKSSSVIPEIKRALYLCSKCDRSVFVESFKDIVNEPTTCECGSRLSFELKHNSGEYKDKQVIKIQEMPDSVPDGTTPQTISIIARNDLVDQLIPGSKVEIVGVLKAVPVKLNPVLKKMKSQFRIFIDLISFKEFDKVKEDNDFIDEINELRRKENVYEILSKSIAPSIFGMDNVKKALLLQLFGGVPKIIDQSSKLRGDINILLAGDPGISKSQLLSFINKISPRSIYTSGRGSSAVGLTASVNRDPDTGQFTLESGALVLSDTGICCIDEFDKMSDITKSVLHEVMEQQTISIAKAGIITTLNARCSILASANPIESKYNVKKTIVENLNLPPTLLSRFDIVALLIDKPDENNDTLIAGHIFDMFAGLSITNETVSIALLKAYVKEARKINPILSEEAVELLSNAYVELRQLDNGNTITATTRQLESLIRLSEAHARMRFSLSVEKEDVDEAIRLIKESLLLYAVDPKTGKIDMDMVITGQTHSSIKLLEDLKKTILKTIKNQISLSDLLENLKVDENKLNEALTELENEELIYFNKKINLIERIK